MVGKIFIMIANAFGSILYFASFGELYISPQISVRPCLHWYSKWVSYLYH